MRLNSEIESDPVSIKTNTHTHSGEEHDNPMFMFKIYDAVYA